MIGVRVACSIVNPASADRFSEEKQDPYEDHFGAQSSHLSPTSQSAVERNAWKSTRSNWRTLGPVTEYVPEGSGPPGLPTNGNPASVRMLSCRLSHNPCQQSRRSCRDLKSNSSLPKRS